MAPPFVPAWFPIKVLVPRKMMVEVTPPPPKSRAPPAFTAVLLMKATFLKEK